MDKSPPEPPKQPIIYSFLTAALHVSLPGTLIRVVLSYSDIIEQLSDSLFLRHLNIDVQTQLLPILHGRYTPPVCASEADFQDQLIVGMQLDAETSHSQWDTATVLQISNHAKHIDHADPTDHTDFCPCRAYVQRKDTKEETQEAEKRICALILFDGDDEQNAEWMSLHPHCYACKRPIPSLLRPFMTSATYPNPRLFWPDYLRVGIQCPRPYLADCTLQMEQPALSSAESNDLSRLPTTLVIRKSLRTMITHILHGHRIIAVTCDDDGRIYALTYPCYRILVITFRPSFDLIYYVPHELIWRQGECDQNDVDYVGFILLIDAKSMVLYIQKLRDSCSQTRVVETMAVALPLSLL